jgi:hypothetical protein
MIARCVLAFACLSLSGCDGSQRHGVGQDERVECAVGPGADWGRECRLERDKNLLTIRHADGGFRRLYIVGDGRGVIPADGAELANVLIVDKGRIEIAIGQDRYRLPARIGDNAL